MKQLDIAKDLSLPVDVVTQTMALLAKRRAGKSSTAKRIVEQLFKAKQQVVVLDPKGDWWGLRSSADGRSEGLPILIIGGEHGDLKLEPGAGEEIARMVVEERLSVLIDLSELRKYQVAQFCADFLEAFYRLKAKEQYRTAVLLVVDEADAIAPQRPQRGEERMLGAIEDIVRRGGQRGIGCLMASQRAAVLNKNVLTQVQILVVLRTIAPQDLDAQLEWIKVHGTPEQREELMASLASLPTGTAWFWSPGWPTEAGIFKRVQVARCETFDSGATPAPGEARVEPKTLADVDLAAVRKRMAATIERAKADDPKELRKQIAELKKQLAARAPAAPAPARTVEKPVLYPKDLVLAERVTRELATVAARVEHAAANIRGHADMLRDRFGEVDRKLKSNGAAAREVDRAATPAPRVPPVAATAVPRPSPVAAAPQGPADMPRPQFRILVAIARLGKLGHREVPRTWVAPLAGTTHSSSGFEKNCGTLKTSGHVEYGGPGALKLTDSGRAIAGNVTEPTNAEILDACRAAAANEPSGRILAALAHVYPEDISREDLAVACDTTATSSGFEKNIGSLKSADMATYTGKARVRAADWMFPQGK